MMGAAARQMQSFQSAAAQSEAARQSQSERIGQLEAERESELTRFKKMEVEYAEVRRERDRVVGRAAESEVRLVELVASSEVAKVESERLMAEVVSSVDNHRRPCPHPHARPPPARSHPPMHAHPTITRSPATDPLQEAERK